MDEVKDLLKKAAIEDLATQEVIKNLVLAISLLTTKVQELEEKTKNLPS